MADDAAQLAARYGYDVEALRVEFDRRSFGSFALGREDERDQFRRAWEIAVKRASWADMSTQITAVAAELRIGADIVVYTPALILTGKVLELGANNHVRARLESPWGVPCPFTEWFVVTDVVPKAGA